MEGNAKNKLVQSQGEPGCQLGSFKIYASLLTATTGNTESSTRIELDSFSIVCLVISSHFLQERNKVFSYKLIIKMKDGKGLAIRKLYLLFIPNSFWLKR